MEHLAIIYHQSFYLFLISIREQTNPTPGRL